MAQLQFTIEDLQELVDIQKKQAIDTLTYLGFPAEQLDENRIAVEVTPNRPDCLCVEGLARALKAFLEGKPTEFKIHPAQISASTDLSVAEVRPAFGCAVVRKVRMTDSLLRSIMQMQEKLHETIGRKRKKVAIGLHDLSALHPPFRYFACGRREIAFVPLNSSEKMTPEQILQFHEKGKEYAHLVGEKCPIIADSKGQVLSFPPIINGELTRVSEKTTELFIDCTGTSQEAVKSTVNILCAAFAQRGAQIEEVLLDGKPYRLLQETRWALPTKGAERLLGIKLSDSQVAALLSRMGHRIQGSDVFVAGYRTDIMSEVDLIEDVAIAYGFNNFEPALPEIATVGKMNGEPIYHQIMIGLGYDEALTWVLSNPELTRKAQLEASHVEIENPLTLEYCTVRPAILPNLLAVLAEGKKERLPIKIYEIGVVAKPQLAQHLAIASMHPKASFSEIKGVLLALASKAGKKLKLAAEEHETFIKGRCAAVYIEGKKVGHMGEVAPRVLVNFGLEQPVCAAEIEIEDTSS
ncbi:MAG: phenylalanine--tRNA ligase subunit beta [Candidatus Micrarchaeota archaeon]|nr:phenylalanine--tRNA ligase subunit beta [Candidatus Micrarchaeota archaeon]